MAVHTGTAGNITFTYDSTNLLVELHPARWTLDISVDTHDTTPFSPAGGARTKIPGLQTATGTATGFLDDANKFDNTLMTNAMSAGTATCLLTSTTGRTFTLEARLSNWSVVTPADSPVTWSLAFTVTDDATNFITSA